MSTHTAASTPPAIVGHAAISEALLTIDELTVDGVTNVISMVQRASINVSDASHLVHGMQGVMLEVMRGQPPEVVFVDAFGVGLAVGVLAARAADRGAS